MAARGRQGQRISDWRQPGEVESEGNEREKEGVRLAPQPLSNQAGAGRWHSREGWEVVRDLGELSDGQLRLRFPREPCGNVQATGGDRVRGLVPEVLWAEWGKGNSS